ncbi:hypothetical protein [Streptosporangium lutulentum]|uniref:Uncharacterized protein n=1 Tax=Streptosporangium lutulentum TaxID=1461250 RepID=A0ABT9Q4N5_9ACTN|nr:hypothetical protein [Streptosporangium lutulentum]MDP9841696.1 hypothetical protein [Streptosporangium lutulentum]
MTKKDHYCNLILNLQKIAYETGTIEPAELRGALGHLVESRMCICSGRRSGLCGSGDSWRPG